MARRRRDEAESSSSASDDEAGKETDSERCPHVTKAVNIASIKKALKISFVTLGKCNACDKERRTAAAAVKKPVLLKDSPPAHNSVWLCLRCGQQFCSSSTSGVAGHVNAHLATPHSDPHCIVLSLDSWKLWCSLCQKDIAVDSYKKLTEAVDFTKKMSATKGRSSGTVTTPFSASAGASAGASTAAIMQRPRGLSNLGNTCFFNSVMQALTRTRPLTATLEAHCAKGTMFHVPSVAVKMASGHVETMDPSVLSLTEAGQLTAALAFFFKEAAKPASSGVLNPGHLFGQVCVKAPQFRGFHQQDAHELLRHLVEAFRAEEMRRQKSAVLKNLGLSEKTDPKSVPEATRRRTQALGPFVNHTLADRVFGGTLVSTVLCEECHNSSQVYEPFLDLSLPLVEEKPPRPSVSKKGKGKSLDDDGDGDVFLIGKKAGDKAEGDEGKSKSQLKKERERKKKEKKQNRRNTAKSGKQAENKAEEDEENEKEGEIEADENRREDGEKPREEDQVHDEIEDCDETKIKNELEESEKVEEEAFISEKKEEKHCDETKPVPDVKDGNEEDDEEEGDDGYGENWEWESAGRQSEERSKSNEVEDLAIERPELNGVDETAASEAKAPLVSLNPLPPERLERGSSEREKSSEDSAAAEAERDEYDADVTGESDNGDVEDNIEMPGKDRLDPHMMQLCRMVDNVSVSASSAYADGGADAAMATEKVPPADNHEWVMRSLSSIGNRYQPSSGECSVYSCLAQFTARELLTGNNKWACDRCTAMQRKDADASDDDSQGADEGKPKKKAVVYSNASKQLLLYSPPAVLTVHLKRFEQTFRGLRKVNRHVSFPLVLDLAPFCASTAVSTSTVASDASKILYSLYAVVEHSGGLQGGHYTAFVKAKDAPSAAEASAFLTCPITMPIDFHAQLEQMHPKSNCNGVDHRHEDDDEPAQKPCKWYHISDSRVTEVTQDKVLSCQAYLLFYERIL